jgi:hypothetical protein
MDLAGALILVALLLAVERCMQVGRVIRRNDERIQERDEILRIWIADYTAAEREEDRELLLEQSREQLREAELVVWEVGRSEGLPHRIARRALGRPVPLLSAPVDEVRDVAQWEVVAREVVAREALAQAG